MAADLTRPNFGINVKDIRTVMQIDLLQHSFDCALAFFINSESFIDFRRDLLR